MHTGAPGKSTALWTTAPITWGRVDAQPQSASGASMTECNRTHDTTGAALRTADAGPIAQPASDEPSTLSRAEISARSASAPTAAERRRWQVIGLLADQAPLAQIVVATGYRPRTIREIAQRYRVSGAARLADRRALSQGAPPLLSVSLQHELRQALQRPPPDGGLWTGPKVAQWMADKIGKRVHRQRGWEYLQRLTGIAEPACAEQPATHVCDDDVDGAA